MAKSKEAILSQLGVTPDSDLNSLLEAFKNHSIISDSEKLMVKQASVQTLPTVVKNNEQLVKERMYGIVTNEEKGAVALMNKRNVLLEQMFVKLREETTKKYVPFEINWTTQMTFSTLAESINFDTPAILYFQDTNANQHYKALIKLTPYEKDNSLYYNVDMINFTTMQCVFKSFLGKSKLENLLTYAEDIVISKAKCDEDGLNIKENYAKKTELFSKDYNDLTNTPKIPTQVSELTNNKGFIDKTVNNLQNYYLKAQTYSKEEINEIVNNISTLSISVVEELPTTNIAINTIYLKSTSSTDEQNVYEEYIYVNNKWELIGSTKIDLSEYTKEKDVLEIIEENSEKAELLEIATSENYNIDSDVQIPTTKTVKGIVDNFKADEFEPFKNEVEAKLDKKANSTDYLPLTGGTIDGDITIKGATTYNDEVTLASTSLFLDSSSIEVDNGDISVSAGSIFTSDGVNIGPNDEVIIDTGGIYLTGQVGITINEEEVALKSDIPTDYLPTSGGTINGDLTVNGGATFDNCVYANCGMVVKGENFETDTTIICGGNMDVPYGDINCSGDIYVDGTVYVNNEQVALKSDFNNHYTKTEVNNLLSNINGLSYEVVQELPASNISNSTIYLMNKEGGVSPNIYEEYLYINNVWEIIGTTEINLSDYATKQYVEDNYLSIDGETVSVDPNSLKLHKNLYLDTNYIEFVKGYVMLKVPSENEGLKVFFDHGSRNGNSNETIAFISDVPTTTSQLTNDSNFVSQENLELAISNAITKVLNEEV